MDVIKLPILQYGDLASVYNGQDIKFTMTAKVVMRELEDGSEKVTLAPDGFELIRDEKRVNPTEILLASINSKLGQVNVPQG